MLRMLTGTVATLALCACGDSGSEPRRVAKVEIANPVSDQLKGGNELFRSIGLRRAIVDSGRRCKKVDGGGYQEQYKNYAMWSVHCTDSGDWAVFIGPSGDAQARPCADLAQLKIPACKPAPRFATEEPTPKA